MTLVPMSAADLSVFVPVVIVGAGAAGCLAALSAKQAGADVLVVERDAVPRGSTALSAGLVPAAGTRWQTAAGIADDPALFARDILHKAHDAPDPDEVALVAESVGPALEWLADRYDLPFSLVENFNYPGHSVCRMHGLPSRSGAELIDRLRGAVEAEGIDLLLSTQATDLIVDERGEPVGLRVARGDASHEDLGCDALVLACNGYGANPDLVARHIPDLAGALYFGHPGNQGEAVLWGEALGAALADLSGHQGHGSVAHPHGILITWATVMEGGFQVNTEGRRFSNESEGYSEQAARVLAQPGEVAWTVFDARIAAIARQFEDFRQAEQNGALLTAPTITDLATAMKIPADALQATFAEVAARAAQGENDAFGRSFAGVAPLSPPFHAVRVTGALFHTQGGLAIDRRAAVMRRNGVAFERLFACGGAARGVSGPEASGYLSGNGLLTAVALGRVAGLEASACAKRVRSA